MGLIGNKPNQTPTNADLGTMAYEDADYFRGNTEIDTLGTVTIGDIKNSALARSGRATIRPSLLLDFAKSKTLDSRITFTRGGIGTYTDANGLVKSATSNEARFDHNPITGESLGLLIEEQRTNLLQYTETYGAASNYWLSYNVALLPNAAIAPDGLLTACKIVESKDSVAQNHYTGKTIALSLSTRYAMSVYLKAGETTVVCLTVGGDSFDGGGASLYVDLSNGTVIFRNGSATADNSGIIPVGNGWYRCYITPTTGSSGNNFRGFLVLPCTGSSTNANYIGNGTSGFYMWGAQLEQGAFATSYIPSADSFTSRASTGTFIGSNGLIQSAATNVARYNYNPLNLALSPKLLLEPAATNLLTYSEQFDNAAWSKNNATVTANATTAPDGTVTADKLIEAATSSTHYISCGVTTVGTTYTATVYAKSDTRSRLKITSWTSFANFDLSAGTVGLSANIVGMPKIYNCGGGWYRCEMVWTSINSQGVVLFIDTSDSASFSVSYTGNGTSGLYIWGAQLEAGNTATSYIPSISSSQGIRTADISSSAQATRPADNAVITGTNFSSWYRQDEGTLFAKADSLFKGANFIASMNNGTNANSINIYVNNNLSQFEINTNSINQANLNVTSSPTFDFAGGYKVNDFSVSYSGSSVLSDSSGTVPQTNQASLGAWFSNLYLNGHIAKVAYYPKRLSNTELQGLTTT
jgi:hypothetical protein